MADDNVANGANVTNGADKSGDGPVDVDRIDSDVMRKDQEKKESRVQHLEKEVSGFKQAKTENVDRIDSEIEEGWFLQTLFSNILHIVL